jgi:RNA polymerase sporulation-specific sigma factor
MPVTEEQRALYIDRLAVCARDNDVAFAELARELEPMLRREARRITVPGAERDDVAQEALIALYVAVLAYDGERTFRPLATTVVRRRLASMLKTALRGKHRALNDLRLEQPVEQGEQLGDLLADRGPGPPELLDQRELLRRITLAARNLTPLERHALGGTLDGRAYRELGPQKTIDNALQRAQRRLREACA